MNLYKNAGDIGTVCCYGTGLMGSGWAAHFLRAGLQVICYDPRPEAEAFVRETVEAAWPFLERLGLNHKASADNLMFTVDPAEAVQDCDFVQESAVEDERQKIELLAALDEQLDPDVLIASSSSGFLASSLRSRCRNGGRVIIGHPFNPPYLIPLVEIVGGDGSDPGAIRCAVDFYTSINSRPVVLDREIDGYIGNRLQMAVWKEILYMLSQGVATVEALDEALVHGPALRWAAIGPSHTFFLGARTPGEYPKFIDLLLRELEDGYSAPDGFFPDPSLIEQYIEQVTETWNPRSHDNLKLARDHTITKLKRALEDDEKDR